MDAQIFKLLKSDFPPQGVFLKIKNHSDTEGVSRFLFNTGLYNTLFRYSLNLLNKKKEVSWHYVIKVLIKYKLYPDEKELIGVLFHTWLKKNTHYALFACEEWGNLSPEFEQMRHVFIDKLEALNISEEKKLLERLAFVQAQEMIKDEEEIINQLIHLNPASQHYKKLKRDLDEKKALLVLQDYKQSQTKSNFIKKQLLKQNNQSLKKDWLKTIVKMSKSHPSYTKDLALFLYFCDSPKSAVELLENHINQIEDYWYYLEWTLETEQFSKGLSVVNYLSKDSRFEFLALLYLKAQFLYGLGKKKTAIQYLHSINQVYPDYKNINYLLHQWSKG